MAPWWRRSEEANKSVSKVSSRGLAAGETWKNSWKISFCSYLLETCRRLWWCVVLSKCIPGFWKRALVSEMLFFSPTCTGKPPLLVVDSVRSNCMRRCGGGPSAVELVEI